MGVKREIYSNSRNIGRGPKFCQITALKLTFVQKFLHILIPLIGAITMNIDSCLYVTYELQEIWAEHCGGSPEHQFEPDLAKFGLAPYVPRIAVICYKRARELAHWEFPIGKSGPRARDRESST
jgi:hypothetical protein